MEFFSFIQNYKEWLHEVEKLVTREVVDRHTHTHTETTILKTVLFFFTRILDRTVTVIKRINAFQDSEALSDNQRLRSELQRYKGILSSVVSFWFNWAITYTLW